MLRRGLLSLSLLALAGGAALAQPQEDAKEIFAEALSVVRALPEDASPAERYVALDHLIDAFERIEREFPGSAAAERLAAGGSIGAGLDPLALRNEHADMAARLCRGGACAVDAPDLPGSVRDLLVAAMAVDAAAWHNLGILYAAGEGVPQDYARAAFWFSLAAAAGIANAAYNLGVLTEAGQGVTQDSAAAVELFREAASAGDENAMLALGMAYRYGRGIEMDPAEAASWFEAAAANDNPRGAFYLGQMHEEGELEGGPDPAGAAGWYRVADDAGDAEAAEALRRVRAAPPATAGEATVPGAAETVSPEAINAAAARLAELEAAVAEREATLADLDRQLAERQEALAAAERQLAVATAERKRIDGQVRAAAEALTAIEAGIRRIQQSLGGSMGLAVTPARQPPYSVLRAPAGDAATPAVPAPP